MSENRSIEIRCNKYPDGKYSAKTYVNGKQEKQKEFTVNRSTEFAIVQLFQHIKKEYPDVEPVVRGLDKHGMEMIMRFKENAG